MSCDQKRYLQRTALIELWRVLRARGYRIIGPTPRDGAIVYRELDGPDDLPTGFELDTAPGEVRLRSTGTHRMFAWPNGPQAIKPWLFPAEDTLWRVSRTASGKLEFKGVESASATALIGLRACDLAALDLHDRHFLAGEYKDPGYAKRREALLLVAVNCTHAGDTCFCASTGDGPAVRSGFDLLLDELDDGFLVTAGSPDGKAVASELPLQDATTDQIDDAHNACEQAGAQQTRAIPPGDLYQALFERRDHPRWKDVAERCLACGNCTSVCPSCFCSREEDRPSLDGSSSDHVRQWDSCFTDGHSYIHGLHVRGSTGDRYRQWLTHKLGSWHAQYGRSGCTGCGRCIAWCPVGIDLTEEVNALLEDES